MFWRWKLYWISLFAVLGGILYWKNSKLYKQRTRRFKLAKTGIEGLLIALSAAFVPAFLVVYGSLWITRRIDKPALKIGVGLVASIILMVLGSFFLELLVIVGMFGIESLSSEFLQHLEERRATRALKEVA